MCAPHPPTYSGRGAHTMYYGYGGGKPGTTHKKLGTTPRFFSRPRPPVRFYTVEALCRTHFPTMHAKYPPVLLRRTSRWMRAPWKQCCPNGPGGDAKSLWTARFIPQSPLSSRILCFPRFAPPAPKNSFRPIISVSSRPPTISHTRSPCCTNLPATLFPPQAPPKSLSWFGTHGLRPCKTATTMSDTIRRPVCTMPFHAPSSHHGTNCPAFSCHTSCIQ